MYLEQSHSQPSRPVPAVRMYWIDLLIQRCRLANVLSSGASRTLMYPWNEE